LDKPFDEKVSDNQLELVPGVLDQRAVPLVEAEPSMGETTQGNTDATLVAIDGELVAAAAPALRRLNSADIPDISNAYSAQDPYLGRVFDQKYLLLSVVGKGGMSIVYEAKHLVMNKIVALKLMHSHLLQSEKAVRRFQKEAQAAAALDHSGIMKIYDIGVSPHGAPYIAMEFLKGKSLSDSIKEEGRLEEGKAIGVFRKIADALAHAHANRVIHRDLKPSNIVLTPSDIPSEPIRATVVDFGIAKLTDEGGEDILRMTSTGEVFGSPLYMSPEQCAGRTLDRRSDIYSFGCLMYEAVTGKTPFEAKTPIALFQSHQIKEAPRFSTLTENPDVSSELEAIILKCLEKHPEDRFQSMDELVEALDSLGDKSAVPALVRTQRRQSIVMIVTGIVLVTVGFPILASLWHLGLGQVLFFALCLVLTGWGSFSMFQRFFKMREAMKLRSPVLNFVQKARLSFTFVMAVLMSVWSGGMIVYVAAKATNNPFIDSLAQSLWLGSLFLVGAYFVGIVVFAVITAITALSNEST
jgi:serine/threonine protein kinase